MYLKGLAKTKLAKSFADASGLRLVAAGIADTQNAFRGDVRLATASSHR